MKHLTEDFPTSSEDMDLYNQAVALYDNIEIENAHIADVNGITMGYLEFGSKGGVPLVWAHGSSSTSYEILNVQAGLVKAGYRVIAVDYRGHGKTQIDISENNNSIYHIADDVAMLMDHLDIAEAVMGGLSKGGWIAAAFYDAYPEKVFGLLLEDGGSFSHLRLKEDVQLDVVQPGPMPYSNEAVRKLYDTSISFKSRLEGLKAMMAVFAPAVKSNANVENIVHLLSYLHQVTDDTWVHHCDGWRHFFVEAGDDIETVVAGGTYYSRLPLMQQSQELLIPLVVFRNLHVPMHIIDPVSPTDWLPVRHQNEELQRLHPELIVHEIYDYEHSPHAAHIERPERFIESAKALLARVKMHTQSMKVASAKT